MDGSLNADTTSRSWMGTLLACLLLALAYGSHFVLNGPDLREAGLALGLGTLLGWIGAWLAAARHLARIEPGAT